MRVKIIGFKNAKAEKGETFDDDNEDDFKLSVDSCIQTYHHLHPGCDNLKIKISKLKEVVHET